MKYELKAPVIDAIQWDGTDTGANKVLEFLTEQNRSDYMYLILSSRVNGDTREWKLEIRGLFDENVNDTMYEDTWLIRQPSGTYEIMSDKRFKELYQEDSNG